MTQAIKAMQSYICNATAMLNVILELSSTKQTEARCLNQSLSKLQGPQ